MKREYSFTVFFEPLAEGGYQVIVPVLPELVTYGDTLEEARQMAIDGIKCHCEGLLKDGEEIPQDVEPVREKLNIALEYA